MGKIKEKEFDPMNRDGFAVSGVLYTLLVLFLVLMLGTLNSLKGKKQILDQIKAETLEALNQ